MSHRAFIGKILTGVAALGLCAATYLPAQAGEVHGRSINAPTATGRTGEHSTKLAGGQAQWQAVRWQVATAAVAARVCWFAGGWAAITAVLWRARARIA